MAKLNDIEGLRFEKLFVLNREANNHRGQARWRCICDCSNVSVVDGSRLRSGMTKSCGCLKAEAHTMTHDLDITGKRVGRLTAVKKLELVNGKGWKWLVRCDCGVEKQYFAGAFNSGKALSCGCLKIEISKTINLTHGKSKTHAYWLRSLAKKRARDNNLPFDLSLEFVEKLIAETKECPYLGIPIKSNPGKLSWNSATLDRVEPALGYVESNVMLISHRANTVKNDATFDEIAKVAIGLAKRLGKLPEFLREYAASQLTVSH